MESDFDSNSFLEDDFDDSVPIVEGLKNIFLASEVFQKINGSSYVWLRKEEEKGVLRIIHPVGNVVCSICKSDCGPPRWNNSGEFFFFSCSSHFPGKVPTKDVFFKRIRSEKINVCFINRIPRVLLPVSDFSFFPNIDSNNSGTCLISTSSANNGTSLISTSANNIDTSCFLDEKFNLFSLGLVSNDDRGEYMGMKFGLAHSKAASLLLLQWDSLPKGNCPPSPEKLGVYALRKEDFLDSIGAAATGSSSQKYFEETLKCNNEEVIKQFNGTKLENDDTVLFAFCKQSRQYMALKSLYRIVYSIGDRRIVMFFCKGVDADSNFPTYESQPHRNSKYGAGKRSKKVPKAYKGPLPKEVKTKINAELFKYKIPTQVVSSIVESPSDVPTPRHNITISQVRHLDNKRKQKDKLESSVADVFCEETKKPISERIVFNANFTEGGVEFLCTSLDTLKMFSESVTGYDKEPVSVDIVFNTVKQSSTSPGMFLTLICFRNKYLRTKIRQRPPGMIAAAFFSSKHRGEDILGLLVNLNGWMKYCISQELLKKSLADVKYLHHDFERGLYTSWRAFGELCKGEGENEKESLFLGRHLVGCLKEILDEGLSNKKIGFEEKKRIELDFILSSESNGLLSRDLSFFYQEYTNAVKTSHGEYFTNLFYERFISTGYINGMVRQAGIDSGYKLLDGESWFGVDNFYEAMGKVFKDVIGGSIEIQRVPSKCKEIFDRQHNCLLRALTEDDDVVDLAPNYKYGKINPNYFYRLDVEAKKAKISESFNSLVFGDGDIFSRAMNLEEEMKNEGLEDWTLLHPLIERASLIISNEKENVTFLDSENKAFSCLIIRDHDNPNLVFRITEVNGMIRCDCDDGWGSVPVLFKTGSLCVHAVAGLFFWKHLIKRTCSFYVINGNGRFGNISNHNGSKLGEVHKHRKTQPVNFLKGISVENAREERNTRQERDLNGNKLNLSELNMLEPKEIEAVNEIVKEIEKKACCGRCSKKFVIKAQTVNCYLCKKLIHRKCSRKSRGVDIFKCKNKCIEMEDEQIAQTQPPDSLKTNTMLGKKRKRESSNTEEQIEQDLEIGQSVGGGEEVEEQDINGRTELAKRIKFDEESSNKTEQDLEIRGGGDQDGDREEDDDEQELQDNLNIDISDKENWNCCTCGKEFVNVINDFHECNICGKRFHKHFVWKYKCGIKSSSKCKQCNEKGY